MKKHELTAIVIDDEKCCKEKLTHLWWIVHGSLRDTIGGLSGIKTYKGNIIRELHKEEMIPEERKKHLEMIKDLDSIFGDILTKCKEMEKIEEKLFYFLPHKPFSFNLKKQNEENNAPILPNLNNFLTD